MKCVVRLIWSSESDSWYTESEDVPGLTLGADSFDLLVERVLGAVPELMELNLDYRGDIELIYVQGRKLDEMHSKAYLGY